MKLSRNEFKLRLQQLETATRTIDAIGNVTKLNFTESPLYTIIDDFMDFLSAMCDIPKNARGDNALSYYVYELEFGSKYTPGCVTEEDGTICPLSNPDELYDDLCKSWGEYSAQT